MATFSERHGFVEGRTTIQTDSLDEDTRIRLWNVIAEVRQAMEDEVDYDGHSRIVRHLWAEFLRQPLDLIPDSRSKTWHLLRNEALSGEWYRVLELVEEFVSASSVLGQHAQQRVVSYFDDQLEACLVGWRFVNNELVRIDRDEERESLVEALTASRDIAGANHHLNRAISHLSEREHPDYPNSIKESISAVEAVVKKMTGEGTLGAGLTKLEGAGLKIHPALKGAWSKMYGWTSDADGIRHAGIEAADADQALAKYVLLTCSAFVSYLIEQGRKANLLQ